MGFELKHLLMQCFGTCTEVPQLVMGSRNRVKAVLGEFGILLPLVHRSAPLQFIRDCEQELSMISRLNVRMVC